MQKPNKADYYTANQFTYDAGLKRYYDDLENYTEHLIQVLKDTRSQLIDSGNYKEGSILIISIDEQIKLAI